MPAAEPTTPGDVITRYALPLIAIGPIAGFIGGQLFGVNMVFATYKPGLISGITGAITGFVLGLVSVIVVALTTVTFVAAAPPKVTLVAPVKSVPVSVTLVPPRVTPLTGEIPVIVGGGGATLRAIVLGLRSRLLPAASSCTWKVKLVVAPAFGAV